MPHTSSLPRTGAVCFQKSLRSPVPGCRKKTGAQLYGICAGKERNTPAHFGKTGDGCGNGRSGDAHFGKSKQSENQNSVQNGIEYRASRTYDRAHFCVIRIFEYANIYLRDPAEQVRTAGQLQVFGTGRDQTGIGGKYPHDKRREKRRTKGENSGNRHSRAHGQGKYSFDRLHILFAPILRRENVRSDGDRRKKQTENELDLPGKRNSGELVLPNHPEHPGIGGTDEIQHELLKSDRQDQREQLPVEGFAFDSVHTYALIDEK